LADQKRRKAITLKIFTFESPFRAFPARPTNRRACHDDNDNILILCAGKEILLGEERRV